MIQDNNFGEKLLETIKEKHILPKPRWQFLFKNYVIWTIGAFALFIGAIATSLIIYMLRTDDWEVYKKIDNGLWEFVLLAIPFFWVFILALFVMVVYFNFKKTKKGYRFSAPVILLTAIIFSILLGTIFYVSGMGKEIDDILGQKAPLYDRLINPHMNFWFMPEAGRFSGLVVKKIDEDKFTVVDRPGKEWSLIISDVNKLKFPVMIGMPIRAIGEKISENEFEAKEILPVGPGRGFYRRLRPNFSGEGANRLPPPVLFEEFERPNQ